MPSAKLYDQTGTMVGSVELDQAVFGIKPSAGLIEEAIVTQLSNRRQPLAHTKTKGEVRGGGRKPWKQKGTGRARHGSIRSPQWKGGGVIFGPRKDRNYERKMNIQAKRKALLMALSDKAAGERVAVLKALTIDQPKTKTMATLLHQLPKSKSHLLVLSTSQPTIVRAGRNIPGLTMIRADSLNVYDVVRHQLLIFIEDALPVIKQTFVK